MTLQNLIDNPLILGDIPLQYKDPQDLVDWESLGVLVEEYPII